MMKAIFIFLSMTFSMALLAEGEEKLLQQVESYYLAEAEEDYETVARLFKPGGKVAYSLDFGALYPDYDFDFVVNNASSFNVLYDESDDSVISNVQWDIAETEVNGNQGRVVVKLSWDYTSSQGDGSVSSEDTFIFDINGDSVLIESYRSEQEY